MGKGEAIRGQWKVLDLAKAKEKNKGSWKKIARAQGPAGGVAAIAQKEEIGTKRLRKIEKLEAEEVRRTKKNREDASSGDVLMIDETAEAASQNSTPDTRNEVLGILGPMQDKRHGKYLGLPSIIGKSRTRRWRADRVRALFHPFEAETILNIPLSYSVSKDSIIWVGNKRGIFTVKNAYYVALPLVEEPGLGECSTRDYKAPLWRKMWNLKLLAKVRIFAWRACVNGLPTRLNMEKRGIDIDATCPLCGKDGEMDVALRIMEAGTSHDLEIFFVTAWSILYNRNQVAHEAQGLPSRQIWGAASEDGRPSGVAMVIRDCKGLVVAASAKLLPTKYGVEVTEALAIEEGILLACQKMLPQVILESDSLSVIQAISSNSPHGDLRPIIQGILSLSSSFEN
ncbi:hypothetical protein SO802_029799 [Lithocarpus litseifolius]|uniref:RNase H type-1 domain-containing protein n=1 Tax=Lithocarpus litseifolius TaxID=425828 RepID=A0AAW2BXB8_9ROSI